MLQIVFYGPTVGMDLAYSYGPAVETGPGLLQVNGIFRDFFASNFCFTVLTLVRTWLIRSVLPFRQDLAYLNLTAFSVI